MFGADERLFLVYQDDPGHQTRYIFSSRGLISDEEGVLPSSSSFPLLAIIYPFGGDRVPSPRRPSRLCYNMRNVFSNLLLPVLFPQFPFVDGLAFDVEVETLGLGSHRVLSYPDRGDVFY